MKKTKLQWKSTLLILILISSLIMSLTAEGAEKGKKAPDGLSVVEFSYNVVTDGEYLYYCPDWSYGLIKRNLKTGKEVVISDMLGVRYLSIYGNSIYFSYSIPSSISYAPYIYKIDKNGKNIKKLVAGDSPIIIEKKIYYIGGKMLKDNGTEYFSSDGIYGMNLLGTAKKKVSSQKTYKIGRLGRDLYYAKSAGTYPNEDYYTLGGTKVTNKIITSNKYNTKKMKKYKIENKGEESFGEKNKLGKVLEGSYKNGKFKYKEFVVFKGENIKEIISCGNNLVVITNGYDSKYSTGIGKCYLFNSKGKKTLLKKWFLAG